MPFRILLAAAGLSIAVAASAAAYGDRRAPLRRLTDYDIAAFASAPFDKKATMFREALTGRTSPPRQLE
jgi:hypothetical protein